MKIRQGFVSNSSSSSFVIMCKSIDSLDLDDIKKSQIKSGEIWVFGKWLSDGQDIIIIKDQKMLDGIKKIMENDSVDYDFQFYNVIKRSEDGEDLIINKNTLPEGDLRLVNVEMDYHSTDNVKDLYERYGL